MSSAILMIGKDGQSKAKNNW